MASSRKQSRIATFADCAIDLVNVESDVQALLKHKHSHHSALVTLMQVCHDS